VSEKCANRGGGTAGKGQGWEAASLPSGEHVTGQCRHTFHTSFQLHEHCFFPVYKTAMADFAFSLGLCLETQLLGTLGVLI
jgi:hypothetical protein